MLVAALALLRGWTWARYDSDEKNVGKEFIFVKPMVYLSNVPKTFAGREIAKAKNKSVPFLG